MVFENTRVMNFENAIRGMRNPKDSWHLSDSYSGIDWLESIESRCGGQDYVILNTDCEMGEFFSLGPKDKKLAQRLICAGNEHRKFMRQIFVSVDITAPLYVWKELDTYKVATTANSTSTMHKLTAYPITESRFEMGDFDTLEGLVDGYADFYKESIRFYEYMRQRYLETKDKRIWKELVRVLPESWLQKRTWTASYETVRSIDAQRKNHKLGLDWQTFGKWVDTLPYSKELIRCDHIEE